MLTLWKAVSICLTSGKKKTNKYAMLHHESNHISTSIFFFNVMSGKASVTLIGGHSVISLSSEPLHASSSYLGPSHHSLGLKSDAT